MQKIKLGEIISSRICQQLTSHMDYKVLKLAQEKERITKVKDKAIDFTHDIFNQIKEIDDLQPEKTIKCDMIKTDSVERANQFSFGKRVSILRLRKSLVNEQPNYNRRLSKRITRTCKQSRKGLVKLDEEHEDLPSFIEYIQKLRQKKIRYAEAMQEFQEKQKGKQIKYMKPTVKQTTRQSDKPFITSFTGEMIKCQKKQTNSKKDDLYLQKIKVKPIFKLKQSYNCPNNENVCPKRRVSISKQVNIKTQESKTKDDYFIKSIIDVITNRSQGGNIRRKRNQPI